jgi:hypothetical protein
MPFDSEDFSHAIRTIWEHQEDYLAVGENVYFYRDLVGAVVGATQVANEESGRVMGYGATLAWGIAIGIIAERSRREREVASWAS